MLRKSPSASVLVLALWALASFLPGLVPVRSAHPVGAPRAHAACTSALECGPHPACATACSTVDMRCGCCAHRGAAAVPAAGSPGVLPAAARLAAPEPRVDARRARVAAAPTGASAPESPPPRA